MLISLYTLKPVSYTHLDVYKRQELERSAEKVLDNSSATISGCFSDLDQMYSNFIENEKVADYMLHASAKDLKTLSSSAQQITALLNDYIVSHQYIASIYAVSYTHLDVYKRQKLPLTSTVQFSTLNRT